MKELKNKLESLCVFRPLLKDSVVSALCTYLNSPTNSTYAEFVAALYEANGGNITEHIRELCENSSNVYVKLLGKGEEAPDHIYYSLMSELDVLQEVAELTKDKLCSVLAYQGFLPAFAASKLRLKDHYLHRVNNIEKYGYGIYAKNRMFYVDAQDRIVPVHNPDRTELSQLVDYQRERQIIVDNTKALLAGKPAANILLTGDAGTGKSTSIKAIVNEYYDKGLRMIEIYKHQFEDLSNVIAQIKNRNYKFIIYMDDLSFEEFETEYKFLKAVIEGGVETKPDNILIYATSNRRHLIKETWKDKDDRDMDTHHSDTMEEKLSLVNRFGVTINYSKPSQKEYFNIVKELAKKYDNITLSDEELCAEANKWELAHGGISGRTAQQFINYLAGMEN